MKKHTLLFLLLGAYLSTFSQNLVLNHGLEDFSVTDSFPKHWLPINVTPDIYTENPSRCIGNGRLHPPSELLGQKPAGKNCFGLMFGYNLDTKQDYSEVIRAELAKPLEKGQKYEVNLYTIVSKVYVGYPMTEVSVYITDEMLAKRMTDNYDIPYLSLKSEEFPRLNVRNGWMKVSNVYTAKGGEKYVYIGNFKGANDAILKKQMNNVTLYVEKISSLTNKLEGVSKYGEAMYMYDNLEVIPIESTIIPKAVDYYLTNKTISAEKTDPIYFDSGKALLREESFRILEKVGDFLFENPEYRLEIHAHTDSDGKAKANQKLSLSRAKAAKAYLVSAGISPKRISTKWFAEKKPAVENKDENAKQLNRRVEFVFIKKK